MAKAQAIPITTESQSLPYIMLVVGIVVGAIAPICVRLAQAEGMPSMVIVAGRLSLATLVLTPWALRNHGTHLSRLSRSDLLYTALAGLMLAAHFLTLFIAFENTSVLVAGVISGSTPLWVALMEVFFLKSRLNQTVWAGLFLALAGGTVIGLSGLSGNLTIGQNPLLGGGLALISAIVAGVYLIAGRKIRTHMPLLLFLWLVFGFAALAALLGVLVLGLPLIGYSTQGYLWLVVLTIGAQLIAQSAFNYSLAFLSATFISIGGQAVTVVASTGALFIFAEIPRPLQIVGSAVIILGVALSSIGQARLRTAPLPEPPT